jgi:flagellin-like hook-associated protein FlgL
MGIKNITDQSIRSTQNAISVVQAAEGARQVAGTILQRILTLTTQKENTVLNASQLSSINTEITSLLSEVGKIRDRTRFQGGSDSIFGTDLSLIAGAGVAARTISIRDLTTDDLGLSGVGSSKTVNSSDLASLFSRQVSASGVVIPTVASMSAPISVTSNAVAVAKTVAAASLNGGQSATATAQVALTAASIQPTNAALNVETVGLGSEGDVRFYVDRAYPINRDIGDTDSNVLYTASAGSSIQGLVSGAIYQLGDAILPATGDYSFQLKTGGTPVGRLGDIVGSGFSFQRVQSFFQFGRFDTSGNTILGSNIGGGLSDVAVVYSSSGGTITGLVHGSTYYLQQVTGGVQLKDISGNVINFNASTASGSFSLSNVNPFNMNFTSQDIRASTLNLSGNSFLVNDQVRYDTDSQDINALQDGNYFVSSVTPGSGGKSSIELKDASGNLITFGGSTGSGTSSVTLISRAGSESNTVTITNNPYQNGDVIRYTQSNSANKISGLNIGATYYVTDVSGNSFKLEDASGNVQSLTSAGTGSQTFTKATVFTKPSAAYVDGAQVIYDGNTGSSNISGLTVGFTGYRIHLIDSGTKFQILDTSGNAINITDLGSGNPLFRTASQLSSIESTDTITIASHGFQNGDVIRHSTSSSSQVGGLSTTGTYYARDVSGNNFKLAATQSGDAIDLTSSGVGTQTFTKAAVFNQSSAPFSDDDLVVYGGNSSGNDAVIGLDLDATYKIHTNNGNFFQLLDVSGNYVNISSVAGAQYFRDINQPNYIQSNAITISGHGFQNGDAITYSSANPITNLSSTSTYYVRDVSGNDFKLSTSAGGIVRDLTGYGSGTQSFAKGTVFNQPSTAFANGTQVIYGGADASGNAITGLTLNATYTVHNIGNGSSFQLLDSSNKVVNASNAGTGNQIFNMNSSSLRLPGHGFSVDDQVTYSGATGAGSSDIGNLPRATYTVKAVTTDTFQLQNPTNANAVISFTSAGNGTHQFSSGAGGPISAASVAAAIQTNARYQAELGMQVNALNFAIDSMETLSSNLAQAYSRIMDVDYATETAALTRNQILQQAATSMLAQANQMPNVILTLLK